nr:DNRLRE domain-containing protein [Acidimicrobiia bacterium]
MKQRSPHLLPGQSDARRAQLLAESPFESLRDEVARGGVFSADKLAALFLVLGLFFSQLGVVGTPAAEAATSVFQEGHGGYRAGLDTEIDETLPDLPGGDKSEASEIRVDSITSGNQQGLIKFGSIFDNDGGPIPIGSTINSATLEINVSSDANPATVVSINRLLGNWPETATWSSTGDGIQLDDVDAVSVVDDVWNPGEVAGPGWRTFDVTTSLAIWAGGAANHGWVITTNDESNGLQFYSSEHTNPVERPRLTIDYTAPEPNVVDEHSNVEAQSVEPAPEAETLEQPETALAELQTPTPEPTVSIERETVPVEEILLGLPVSFEQNVGQAADQSVDIVARGSAYAVSLADGDAIVVVGEDGAGYVFRMNVLGRANQPALVTHGEQAGSVNYLIGDDPDQWLTDVSTFDAVEYRDVYPGVDLRYYGNLQQLQYDFIVQPGADPSSIALGFDGATSLSVDDTGGLVVGLDGSRHVTFSAPVTYQNIGGTRQPVKSAYLLTGDTVQFEVGTFDPTEPLIIDPTLVYSTEVGGTQIDRAADVAVDASGNAYITGHTQMSSFPTTVGPHGTPGSFAIMVTKLSADGSSIVYSTYVGGSGPDAGDAIEVDGSGNAYVSGDTNSSNFPTANGFDTSHTGSYDAVLFKLDPTG